MAFLKINCSSDVSEEKVIAAIPLSEVFNIAVCEGNQDHSVVHFRDIHGDWARGAVGLTKGIYVAKSLDELCQIFADCAERKTVVDLTDISQSKPFSQKPNTGV